MADIIPFLRDSWKHLWKQNIIWIFSILPAITRFLPKVQAEQETNFSLLCLAWINLLLTILASYVSFIGVSYIAYRFLIGSPATIQETFFTIRKFLGRVVSCSCLIMLIVIPLFVVAVIIVFGSLAEYVRNSDKINLVFLPFSIFSAVLQFTLLGFFSKDFSIKQSLKESWSLYTKHFGVLAAIGFSLAIAFGIFSSISGVLTVLIQSRFDVTSLGGVNYINPSASLSENVLFMILDGFGQIFFLTLGAFVYVSAYLKYNGIKPHQL